MLKSFLFFLLFLVSQTLFAEVWIYSYPNDVIESSPFYKVQLIQNKKMLPAYVCFSQATTGDLERSNSWTTFSFDEKIEIEVEVLGVAVSDFDIKPNSKNIEGTLIGNKIHIELQKPQKLCVEINGNKQKPLFIFADSPEETIPEKNGSGLWFFEPGFHTIGIVDLPDTVKHVYIAGGAFVEGAFRNKNRASNIKITGRGILCSPGSELAESNTPIVDLSGEGINSYVEGVTILGDSFNGIVMNQSYSTLRNCKLFEWKDYNGGIMCGPHGLIEDCFFRCNSDVIKMHTSFLRVQNCMFWQNETGAPFQLGYNLGDDFKNFRVINCDIVHCEHQEDAINTAIFSSVHAGAGNLSNYLFENICIEGDVFRLFKLTLRTNVFDTDTEYGSISNIQFRNIKLDGKCIEANEIWGYNQEHRIDDVTFENLKIGGKKILNAADGNFKINLNTSSEIVFR